jgi:hypothetical protein
MTEHYRVIKALFYYNIHTHSLKRERITNGRGRDDNLMSAMARKANTLRHTVQILIFALVYN